MLSVLSDIAASLLSGVACGVADFDNGAPLRVYLFNCFGSVASLSAGILKYVDFAELSAETGGIFSLREMDLGSDLDVEDLSAAAEVVVAGFLAALGDPGLGDAAAAVRGLAGAMAGSDRAVPSSKNEAWTSTLTRTLCLFLVFRSTAAPWWIGHSRVVFLSGSSLLGSFVLIQDLKLEYNAG